MKSFLTSLFLFIAIPAIHSEIIDSSFTSRTISIPGNSYILDFEIYWSCNDFPVTSTPGRVELINSQNQMVGWAEGHVTHSGATSQSSLGSTSVHSSSITILSPDLTVADGVFSGRWTISGVPSGTYTLRFWNYEYQEAWLSNTSVWTQTVFQSGYAPPPPNQSPVVTLLGPGSQTITAGTTLTITSRATDADGNLTNHNLDIQRPAGDWNFQGGFATGEPYQGGPVGSAANSTRSANFTFSDVGTYQIRSGASDGSGWSHSATISITVAAPPPPQYTLTTASSGGGTVTLGGTYPAGTTVMLSATPDATHRFVGWVGDAQGANPSVVITMNSAKWVQAIFAAKSAQSISFEALANQNVGTILPLTVNASSNLPVTLTVISGPATLNGTTLTIDGPGTITLQASQAGNDVYLPAPLITRVFNASAPAVLKFQRIARTLLQSQETSGSSSYLIQP